MTSGRLPRVSGREVVNALLRGGFKLSHVRGSHHYLFRHDAPGLVDVPVHSNRDVLAPGTLHAILQQAGLTREEFNSLLRG